MHDIILGIDKNETIVLRYNEDKRVYGEIKYELVDIAYLPTMN